MMVRDGVTTALELEAGTADVAEWYSQRSAGQLVNYGVSVGQIPARMRVLGDPSDRKDILPSGIAAAGGATVHIHMRNGPAGLDSTVAAAKAAGARLHIVHVNSSGGDSLAAFLTAIQRARDAGVDVTTEAYPYGAGMTSIQSAIYDNWATRAPRARSPRCSAGTCATNKGSASWTRCAR